MKPIEELRSLNPCKDGLEWAKQQPSLAEAWDTCQRSDWMWWLLMNINKCPRKLSIQYSKWCADSVKHLLNTATTAESEAANAATNAGATIATATTAITATTIVATLRNVFQLQFPVGSLRFNGLFKQYVYRFRDCGFV